MFGKGHPRPNPFQPGTRIGDAWVVDQLVRLAEGRMFYLTSRVDSPETDRTCDACGHPHNPAKAKTCVQCGEPLKKERFLMSVRWAPEFNSLYQEYFRTRKQHPAILSPTDIIIHDSLLCSVVPIRGESLLLDECAPLPASDLMRFAQRLAGVTAFLNFNGVELARLSAANFLLDRDRNAILYDLDICALHPNLLAAEQQKAGVHQSIDLLRRFSPVDYQPLTELLNRAEDGYYTDTATLGADIQSILEAPIPGQVFQSAAAITDVGLVRDLNEDYWTWTNLHQGINLFVVADGMGGHESGEVASALAATTICRVARDRVRNCTDLSADSLENILDEAFQAANNTVKEQAESCGNDMGTTLVSMMTIGEDRALLANVGDSRAYLLRNGVLYRVTRDHSLVQRLVDQNRITEQEARTHPHSNILLRTVGTERNVQIDIYLVEIEPGDRVLLCSDGLWGEVEDEDIASILNHYSDLRTASRELVRAAHNSGGRDNITIIITEHGR